MVTRAARAGDEPRVVGGLEEHLGDGEVRTGGLLRQEHLDVALEARRVGVARRIGRDAHRDPPGRELRGPPGLDVTDEPDEPVGVLDLVRHGVGVLRHVPAQREDARTPPPIIRSTISVRSSRLVPTLVR